MTKAPEVHCAYDEMVALADLKENPRNPNRHPEEQIALLAKLIEHHGWRAPVTVSKRSGLVVRGHGRLAAARLLGLPEVPVDYQDYESDEAEWADLIADNRVTELAEKDYTVLRDVLEELDTGAFDMDLTGYDEGELERLMTAVAVPDDAEGGLLEDGAYRTFTAALTAEEDAIVAEAERRLLPEIPLEVTEERGPSTAFLVEVCRRFLRR